MSDIGDVAVERLNPLFIRARLEPSELLEKPMTAFQVLIPCSSGHVWNRAAAAARHETSSRLNPLFIRARLERLYPAT